LFNGHGVPWRLLRELGVVRPDLFLSCRAHGGNYLLVR
jgi:hypothetical protein